MYRVARWLTIVASAALSIAPATVDAQPVVVTATRGVIAQYLQDGAVEVDRSDTGLAPARLEASALAPVDQLLTVGPLPGSNGFALATIYGDAISSIELNGHVSSTGLGERRALHAQVSETLIGANASGADQRLAFSFELKHMLIEVWDNFGAAGGPDPFATGSDAIGAEIRYDVERDGVSMYRTMARVYGGSASRLTYNNSVDRVAGFDTDGFPARELFNSFLEGSEIGATGEVPNGFAFSDLAVANLDLGVLASLEMFEVTATMSATVLLPAYAVGAGVRRRKDAIRSLRCNPQIAS